MSPVDPYNIIWSPAASVLHPQRDVNFDILRTGELIADKMSTGHNLQTSGP